MGVRQEILKVWYTEVMEKWKQIEGFSDYEVSDLGRVRSKERRVPSSRWIRTRRVRERILKTHLKDGKYPSLHLFKNGKSYMRLVHRLVAQAFLPNPLNLPEVNHKGKTTDSRACKLEWLSTKDHGRDRAKREQVGDGVYFVKASKREPRDVWRAVYYPEPGKSKYIGSFVTYEEAKVARDAKIATL